MKEEVMMKRIKYLILVISITICMPIILSFSVSKVEAESEQGILSNGGYVI